MLKCYYEFEKFGGKKNWKSRRYQSKSFVKAFLSLIYRNISQQSFSTLNVNNSSQATSTNYVLFVNSGGGDGSGNNYSDSQSTNTRNANQNIGIVVGTGNTAVTAVDYALVTKVAHGNSSGQLQHFGSYVSPVTTSNPNSSCFIERIFRNVSGGSIVIAELGMQTYGNSSTSSYPFLIVRDVLGATVTVANNEYLKVKYTVQITI